ncbi:MAG: hypothetical protein U0R80_11015 [Nocardioidaceae bacterium]
MERRDSDSAVSAPEPTDAPTGSGDWSDDDAREDGLGSLDWDSGMPARQPDWWHRDHPTFTALTGFFAGLVTVAVLPALFVGVLRAAFSDRAAEEAFPFVLLFLAVPIGLMVFPRTRRFGTYLMFGMAVTLLVVFGVGTFVFWLMLRSSA